MTGRLTGLAGHGEPAAAAVTHEDLWARVPQALRAEVIEMHDRPWSEVIYVYEYVGQRRLDLRDLPEPMRHELVWWLWHLHQVGERITPIGLTVWKNLIPKINEQRGQHGLPAAESFTDLSFDEWMAHARAAYAARYGRLPGKSFGRNYEHIIDRIRHSIAIQYDEYPWWAADRWDPVHDHRIPLREHETRGWSTIGWGSLEPGWLRDATRWWLSTLLTANRITWTSAVSYATVMTAHVGPFLRLRGVDHPRLVADPATELRLLSADLTAWLRTQTITKGPRAGGKLSTRTVHGIQTVLTSFYGFMFDHRAEAARILTEPRWLELSEVHLRLWAPGERLSIRKAKRAEPEIIEDAVLDQITAHLDILGLPPGESRTVTADGAGRVVQGIGDPQAMRAFLLIILTGRRLNEICMLDPDPIEPLLTVGQHAPEDDPDDPGRLVARLRYQQTKITGAPNTIPVEQAVVNVIREQQQWVAENIRPRLSRDEHGQPAQPRYLFLAPQRNQRGIKPYHPSSLQQRLTRLARQLQLTDSAGRIVDFQRTHRLRHTKATALLNAGVPMHVVQRYLGHASPEMTLWYAETLASTQEQEFLRLALIGADGRDRGVDNAALLDVLQLEQRTDRILPNGYCLLPRPKVCDRGNACLTCGEFATSASFASELTEQRSATLQLIQTRKRQHQARTGREMTDDNIWLQARMGEINALDLILAAIKETPGTDAMVQGAGSGGRPAARTAGKPRQPIPTSVSIDTSRWRRR
jgi:integrase